jgi:hypothetical protein
LRKERQAEKLQRRDERRVKRNEPADQQSDELAVVELGDAPPPINPPAADGAPPAAEAPPGTK